MSAAVQPAGRSWLPRSMASRLYLIIFAGLLLAYGVTFGLLFVERYQSATTVMLNTIEHEVGTAVAMLDRLPAAERPAWLGRLARGNYRFLLGHGEAGTALESERARYMTRTISREVGPDFHVHGDSVSSSPERYQIHFTLHDGSPLTLEITPHGVMPVAQWLPVVFVLQMALLLLCTWLAVRLATRPLTALAQAAEAMTPGADGPLMAEDGPTEVAHAATAFNAMQDRIGRHLKERLHILAAISHDLQTPITRMRLRVEAMADAAEQQRILDDLRQLEHLVREGLAYARSAQGGAETPMRIDLASFLESLVFDYQDVGQAVTLSGEVRGTVMIRRQALRRILGNLIDNAVKYGGSAEVAVSPDARGALRITVSDRGPGIPADELEQVLQPFYRLEASRNRDTGGTGLGLAIAAQLASSIGGNLRLSNREGGGLTATVSLP